MKGEAIYVSLPSKQYLHPKELSQRTLILQKRFAWNVISRINYVTQIISLNYQIRAAISCSELMIFVIFLESFSCHAVHNDTTTD